MKQAPLFIPFIIACFFALFSSALFHHIKFFPFSPFLGLAYYRLSLPASLWVSVGCGFLVDLFSSDLPLGIHALNYSLVSLLAYSQKRHFFEDKPLALCLFTSLISITSTLIHWLFLPLCGRPFIVSKGLVVTDLLILPMGDAVYTFVCFCCPLMLYSHIKKVGWNVCYNQLLCWLHIKDERSSNELGDHDPAP